MLDDIRDAADVRRDRRAAHAGALGDGIGEGLGKRRQRIDVQRVIEAVHIRDPARKHDAAGRAGVSGQLFQRLALLAVARDEQADIGMLLNGKREAADERPDVLDRVETGGNAKHDGILRRLHADGAQIRLPVQLRHNGRKINAIVNRKHRLRVEAARDEQLRHRIGHADVIVEHAQRDGVDRAVGQPVQGAAQIVEAVVGVDGRDNGNLNFPAQNCAGQIGARAVAVDDLKALGTDHLRKAADGRLHGGLHDDRIDTELSCILRKLSLAEADQTHLFGLSKPLQQRQHVCLRAADVAAGDQMQYLHIGNPHF